MAQVQVQTAEELHRALTETEPGGMIRLAPGVYRGKFLLQTPGLTLVGAGAERTELVWGDYARKLDEQGQELNTFRTWTLAVCGDGTRLQDLSVVNEAQHPEEKGQEVALSVYGDDFHMEHCTLRSTQDTLFLGPLPPDLTERYEGFLPAYLNENRPLSHQLVNCRIEGTVDFIFGCGRALLKDCQIHSLREVRGRGYVAAPAHPLELREGFMFRNCRFTCAEGVPRGSVYLARPWRDYGIAQFDHCLYGPHIAPEGFDPWNDSRRDLTARFWESPPVPGRVHWLRNPG